MNITASDILKDSFSKPEINTLMACSLTALSTCILYYISSGRAALFVLYIIIISIVVFTIWFFICVSDTSRKDFTERIKSTINIIRSVNKTDNGQNIFMKNT